MEVTFSYKNNCVIAELRGELDHHSGEHVKKELKKEIEKDLAGNLILECSKLTFMDSSGLGIILGRYKELRAKKSKMILCGLRPNIKKVINLSGVDKIIKCYPDLKIAIKAVKEEY
ncbi:anti-sigma factor antagonist [Proteinivorax hydrogeniformans]|uniref:Anti-sigma factor antagonist n=1 Tax=Proteinivorax hydrogeniformans TaxID=1826727 RepID=A0AAU8HQB4_9FIRM